MEKQFSVGLDCHQASINGAILDQNGQVITEQHFENTARALEAFVAPYRGFSRAVLEASSASLPIYDQLMSLGISTVVANPLRLRAIWTAPVKNDRNDAMMLAKLLHANVIPVCYVPPKPIRELRDLLRSYRTLVEQRTQAKNRIRSVLTRHRFRWKQTNISSAAARTYLASLPLGAGARAVIMANLGVIDALQAETLKVQRITRDWNHASKELALLQTIPGFGPFVSRVFISEVGDITRFSNYKKLCCFAGLVPGLNASGTQAHATGIIKASNTALRYAMVIAAWPAIRHNATLRARYNQLKARGKSSGKAIVAIAHHLLKIAYILLTKQTPYRACAQVRS